MRIPIISSPNLIEFVVTRRRGPYRSIIRLSGNIASGRHQGVKPIPRYFFDAKNGTPSQDDEGIVLKDLSAARKRAIVFAGEVMHYEPEVLWDGREFLVEVYNENRLLLFTITAYATNAPAAGDTR